jgi:hypothetical protein
MLSCSRRPGAGSVGLSLGLKTVNPLTLGFSLGVESGCGGLPPPVGSGSPRCRSVTEPGSIGNQDTSSNAGREAQAKTARCVHHQPRRLVTLRPAGVVLPRAPFLHPDLCLGLNSHCPREVPRHLRYFALRGSPSRGEKSLRRSPFSSAGLSARPGTVLAVLLWRSSAALIGRAAAS